MTAQATAPTWAEVGKWTKIHFSNRVPGSECLGCGVAFSGKYHHNSDPRDDPDMVGRASYSWCGKCSRLPPLPKHNARIGPQAHWPAWKGYDRNSAENRGGCTNPPKQVKSLGDLLKRPEWNGAKVSPANGVTFAWWPTRKAGGADTDPTLEPHPAQIVKHKSGAIARIKVK